MATAARPSTIAIRALRSGDVRAVERIERDAYGATSPRTAFRRELRNGLAEYLVAELGEGTVEPPAHPGIVARLLARVGVEPGSEPIAGYAGAWFTHEQLHLVTIAVAPAHQGRGIGQALLLAVCELAVDAGLDSLALEVRPSNGRAIRLYEGYGFRHHGRLRRYYADNGEDALVMLLDGLATPEGRAGLERLRVEHARGFAGHVDRER